MNDREPRRLVVLADGESAHTQRWCLSLAEKNLEVILVTFRPTPIIGVTVIPINEFSAKYISPTSSMLHRFHYIFSLNRIKKIIHKLKPDIIHSFYATSYGLLGALTFRSPFFVSVWGMDITDSPNQPIIRSLVKFVLARTRVIFSTSNFLAGATQPFMSRDARLSVVPFGIDPDVFNPSEPKRVQSSRDPVIIGSTKSFEEKYGLSVLIDAFSILANRSYSIKLVLVGSGSLKSALEQKIKAMGLSDKVEFRPAVSHDKIPSVLESFDIYVMPSISESETFGVAALEASAMAVPVVGSRIGGIPEVIDDGLSGYLVEPDNVDDLTHALEKLVKNPELRQRLGSGGRKLALQRYAWSENIQSVYDTYSEHY